MATFADETLHRAGQLSGIGSSRIVCGAPGTIASANQQRVRSGQPSGAHADAAKCNFPYLLQ